MPSDLSDDQLFQQYMTPPQKGAPTPKQPQSIIGPSWDTNASSNPDDGIFNMYMGKPDAISKERQARMAGAVPGPKGLVWNEKGGFDPKTGELIIGTSSYNPKAFSEPPTSAPLAASMSALSGAPIVGPMIEGGAQRAAAGVHALLSGDPYDKSLGAVQSVVERSKEANPILSTASNIGGSIAATAPFAATALGARMFGITGPNLAARVGTSTLAGAGIGGTDAAIRSGLDPSQTVAGGILGGILGGAAPIAGSAISAIGRGFPSASGRAVDFLQNALAEGGATPAEVGNALSVNPRLSLMDVDHSLRNRAVGLSQTPGKASEIVNDAVRTRMAGAPGAIAEAYDSALGKTPDVQALLSGLQARARQNAAVGYGNALAGSGPVDVDPVIRAIDRRLGSPASPETAVYSTPVEAQLAQVRRQLTDGTTTLSEPERVHTLQAELRTQASALSQSASGQDRLVGSALGDVRNRLVNALDLASGGKYKPAARQYADDLSVRDAFHQGLNVFQNRAGEAGLADRPEAWRNALNTMSQDETDALKMGVRTAVDQKINATRFAARTGAALPDVGFNRDKLDAVLGRSETNRLVASLKAEQQIADTNSALFGGSPTAPRGEAIKSVAPREVAPMRPLTASVPPLLAEISAGQMGIPSPWNHLAAAGLASIGVGRNIAQRFGRASDIARNIEMARMLSAQQGTPSMLTMNALAAHASPAIVGPTVNALLPRNLPLALMPPYQTERSNQ